MPRKMEGRGLVAHREEGRAFRYRALAISKLSPPDFRQVIHYVRDVTFGEDPSTLHIGHSPQNLAALRHRVIGLCALDAARKGKRASYLPRFRAQANDHRQVAIDLLARPLPDGS